MNIEELYKRSHKKCRYDSPDSRDRDDLTSSTARKKEQRYSKDNTNEISDDPDVLEFTLFPCVYDNESDSVIGRYSEVSGHVECRTEADYHYTDDKVGIRK